MKPGVSTLNPYAAAYIPLSKRELEPALMSPNQHYHNASFEGSFHVPAEQFSQDVFSVRNQPLHSSFGGSSQNVNVGLEKQILDEEFDIDLDFLQMTFPGLSEQSLAGVYLANKGDLEATVDMLNQLEFHTVESSESLPDTLDIGDVSEPGSSAHFASLKLKNISGSAEGSSESADSQVVS
ncbi:polyadenylate-binding protein-interacting protein 5-like [Humulus lupulus]|uniref:polyadenylate-binding protein-interacting protein 5-like n=1 Tax=Humulus lupulus TaxID=3486 RepID=UPI002B4053F9|nr:polyadenylate-binding protein-interacting protein 5-like [Humulus lupulus]XP_062089441.1 polyadenylate-binding protein-interacting protein 5-like [Humulus lupulus]